MYVLYSILYTESASHSSINDNTSEFVLISDKLHSTDIMYCMQSNVCFHLFLGIKGFW